MTDRSRAQVDKDIARRQAGIRVAPSGSQGKQKRVSGRPGDLPVRSAAQVEKDAARRAAGVKVSPRGRLSDAATGRLSSAAMARSGGAINKGGTAGRKYDRDRIGRFA